MNAPMLLLYDFRQAVHRLSRARGFTCMAILTLAMGIGAAASMYSALDAVLLRPLPFQHPEQLVVIDGAYAPPPPGPPKIALDLYDWQAMKGTFDAVGAYLTGTLNLATSAGATRVAAAQITPNLFHVLGVQPHLGRSFTTEEGTPGHEQVVILSEGFWRRQFGAATDILGRVVTIESQPFVVVGVMPDDFAFPAKSDVWMPYALPEGAGHVPLVRGDMITVARLPAGLSIAEAQARATGAERRFASTHDQPAWVNHVKILTLRSTLEGDSHTRFRLLAAAAALMLLLACANVAGLLLARAEARQHDLAVRLALGASSWHLVRALVAEGVILAAGGAAGRVVVAWALGPLLSSLVPKGLLGIASIGLNSRVLVGALVVGVVSVLLFCLIPAVAIGRTDVNTTLRSSGSRSATRSGSLWHRVLMGQIGLTVVILVGSGLLLRSIWLLGQVDPGFSRSGVLSVDVTLPRATYKTRPQRAAYVRKALARLNDVPGIREAGVVSTLPLSGRNMGLTFDVVGRPKQSNQAHPPITQYFVASPGYFAALRIPVLAGRGFTEADAASGASVMLVDEKLARGIGPVQDAVGHEILMPWDSTYRIIGVVRTVLGRSLDGSREWQGQFYLPARLDPAYAMTFVARGPVNTGRFVQAVREAIGGVDPSVPAYSVRTVEDVVSGSLGPLRTITLLLTVAAAFGLVLAVVGVFGVTSASVARRTREIGIRMALGASGTRIGVLILRQVIGVAAAGVALGLLGAWASARLVAHLLYGVRIVDPIVFMATLLAVCLAVVAASAVPLWRARSVDPLTILHSD